MRDADDATVVLGHKPEHRFICIRETLECGFRHLGCKTGLLKFQIAKPQWQPC